MSNKNNIVESFLEHNRLQSSKFTDPGQTLWRRQYRAKNPVEIAAMKCMDGRINLSVMTGVPVGIIQPFRNLGGRFDIGGHFGELLAEWVSRGINSGKDCIILVTYHWSKGLRERGCKGFHYDVDEARKYTNSALRDIEQVFGMEHIAVYPVQVGIETDEDGLVFHGVNGKKLDLSEVKSEGREELRIMLEELFPDMKRRMIESLIDLCEGNIKHISEIRKSKRPVTEIDHKEHILAVGRGFDWFHLPNKMLIVGPYSFDLAEPVTVAGRILLDNINSGRMPKDGGYALITSAVYRDEAGPEKRRAAMKARSLLRFSLATLKKEVPELVPYLKISSGILNENTRLFTAVDFTE